MADQTTEIANEEAPGDETITAATLADTAGAGPVSYPGWVMPNAENLEEGIPEVPGGVRWGTCQETAILIGLHCLDPEAWPLNGVSLGKITNAMIAAREASGNGSSTPSEGVWELTTQLGADVTYYGFRNPFPADQLADIYRAHTGAKPVVTEFAHAGAMHDDEGGVFFHYEVMLGGDASAQVFVFGDGDALPVRISRGLGPCEVRSWQDIQDGIPCAVTVIEGWPMNITQVSDYFTQNDPGHWTVTKQGHPSEGLVVRGGILDAFRTWRTAGNLAGFSDWGCPLENEHPVPGFDPAKVAAQRFERCTVIWDKDRLFDDPPGAVGEVYKAHVNAKVE